MDGLVLERLQELFADGKVIWSHHIHTRLQQRSTGRQDVCSVLFKGRIIEQYPDDYPHPSCLISGTDTKGRPLHLVVACNGDFLTMITVYYPDLDTFESDYETRKER